MERNIFLNYPTPEQALEMLKCNGKRHLLITGDRGVGKSTLFNKIVPLLSENGLFLPGLTSRAIPKKHVVLIENGTEITGIVGVHCPEKAGEGRTMIPASDGFFAVGVPALRRAVESESEWISIDELGFLESREKCFQEAVRECFDRKRVIAVVRKQPGIPFLAELANREDIFLLDLDANR